MIDLEKMAKERVFVYCSNPAENYLVEYNSLEDAKKDKDNWKDREVVMVGYSIENILD